MIKRGKQQFLYTVACLSLLAVSCASQAVALSGLLGIDPGANTTIKIIDPSTKLPVMVPGPTTGSTFTMGGPFTLLAPGTAGGILLGQYQNFVLDPDVPHPEGWQGDTDGDGIPDGMAGAGYSGTPVVEGTLLAPFNYFGSGTYIGTNPISYQSGEAHGAPTADVDMSSCVGDVCTLSADLSSFEVMWNGSAFEQGPRPVNTGPFVLAMGTYNLTTKEWALDWDSHIKGGPFNGVLASWHLEGTHVVPIPGAVWLFGSGLLGLASAARRRS